MTFAIIIYLTLINIIAVVITIHDKLSAIRHRRRVSEFALLLVSALGGAVGMYVTMLLIRHKTRKPKFMVGIPLIFLIELVGLYLLLHYVFGIL